MLRLTMLLTLFFALSMSSCRILGKYSPCTDCEKLRGIQDAKMVFLEKDEVCSKLFNIKFEDFKEISEIRARTCSSADNIQYHLQGYYIEPSNLNLSMDGNSFKFYPVWVSINGNIISEITTSPIHIGVIGQSISAQSLSNQPINNVYTYMELITSGFNHNIFQFNNLAIAHNFMKAYISKHELMQIMIRSKYLGICGATVETGNIASFEGSNNVVKIDNKEFFTYRFVGFNSASGTSPIPNIERLIKANLKESSANMFEFIHDIPAETWAVPCPPMWRPQ